MVARALPASATCATSYGFSGRYIATVQDITEEHGALSGLLDMHIT